MKTPSVVVFDLGKVLVDFDYGIAARKIAQAGKVSQEEAFRVLLHTPSIYHFECGHISKEEFYTEICAGTGYASSIDEFACCFSDIFSEIAPMVELHAALRAKSIPTFIFSNTNDWAVRHIRARFPFFHHFTGYIFSYQHGCMKPDGKLYEIVEQETRQNGGSILYLDDRAENVAVGLRRGWQAMVHYDPAKTVNQVRELCGIA